MTKMFREKVLQYGTVDTKTYRYRFVECGDHGEIRRVRVEYLGTTAALDGWETVEVVK